MSAEELIALLKKHNVDHILVAADAEGNSFSALCDVSEAYVEKDYKGGRTEEVWFAEEFEDDEDGELDMASLRKVLVVWPV
jgi:hypothetical protein